MGTRRTFPRHARNKVGMRLRGLVVLGMTAAAVVSPTLPLTPAHAAATPCLCGFDFEDGTTQGWGVEAGQALAISNQSAPAFAGHDSLKLQLWQAGSIVVSDPGSLAGVTNGTEVTYRLYSPLDGVVTAQAFAKDRTGARNPAASLTLRSGWNTLTWQVPFQFGVSAIGLSLSPRAGWTGSIALDAVSWPDSFVRRESGRLSLSGQDYRFAGVNIYNANSSANCWYSMASNDLLDTSLKNQTGLKVFRAWFFQSLATRSGARDWTSFDHTLAVAAANGFKVIVTLGNEWTDCDSGSLRDLSWFRGGYQFPRAGELVGYRQWVQQVVSRYRNDPTIAMWQLLNEASAFTSARACQESTAAAALRSFSDNLGGLIHGLDANHLVSLGTVGSGECGLWGSDYSLVHGSTGIDLCEYHDYGAPASSMPGDQWNGLQVRLDQCASLGKPLFIGESGIHVTRDAATVAQRAAFLQAKLAAQAKAGVVGLLAWDWNATCTTACTGYEIGPGDPSLMALRQF